MLVPLRVTAEQEEQGLDVSQHGESMGELGVAPMATGLDTGTSSGEHRVPAVAMGANA